MAMQWLKGLVAPAAQFAGQQLQPGGPQVQPDAPPVGGAPPPGGSPYGVQAPSGVAAATSPAQGGGFDASQMQWSTGTKTQGGGASPRGVPSALAMTLPQTPNAIATATSSQAASPPSLEARCAQLQHDVESLALFARTLLTMLEEAKIVTREQFETTKHRLDLLDGKLDDR